MYADQNANHIVLFLENKHKQTIESFTVGGKLERICTIFKLYFIKTWYCVTRNILRPYINYGILHNNKILLESFF